MTRLLQILLLLTLVYPVFGQELSVLYRQRANGAQSILVGFDAAGGVPVDELRIKVPGRLRRSAQLGSAPSGWRLTSRGGELRAAGALVEDEPVRVRLDVGANRLPGKLIVSALGGGRVVRQVESRPQRLPQVRVVDSLEGLVVLPSVVEPGEGIEFSVLDEARTPPDGRWTVAGQTALPGSTRLSVQIPQDASPGNGLTVEFTDLWGETTVAVERAQGVEVQAPSEFDEGRPRVTGCSRQVFAGRIACVCGVFPQGSATAVMLDGRPLGDPLSVSRRVLHFRAPADASPGAHVVAGDPEAGFSVSDQAMLVALRAAGSIDQSALIRGESTRLRLTVEGTQEPLALELENRTPEIISIEGGATQTLQSSGGADNQITKRVDAVSRGDFDIRYSLAASDCPCNAVAETNRTDDGYIPGRVLAIIANAAPAALLATAQAIAAAIGLNVVEATPLNTVGVGTAVFQIPDARTVPAVVLALNADARVQFAQPEFVYEIQGQAAGSAPEPYGALSYGAGLTRADKVREVADGRGVRIAVIDTGVDVEQVDLIGQIAEKHDFTGKGFSADIHGTQVAGIVAALPGNGAGIAGVAPGAEVVALKACHPASAQSIGARCWSSALAKALDHAAGQGADIVNLSVGGRRDDRLLRMAVETAVNGGALVVAAAGNDGPGGPPSYPASLPGVVAVTAVDARRQLYRHATHGEYVDLSAPGVEIISPAPGNQFPVSSGTSFAAPYVSGTLALLRQVARASAAEEVVSALEKTAADLGPEGPDSQFGRGLIDACSALRALGADVAACE